MTILDSGLLFWVTLYILYIAYRPSTGNCHQYWHRRRPVCGEQRRMSC